MISIIIPAFNEALQIPVTIKWLKEKIPVFDKSEIIVVDGGSTDDTVAKAREAGAITIISPFKGRAAQMNFGAFHSKGTILYFLHADTLPPENFIQDIHKAIKKNYGAGCFMLSFDHSHWFLKANCWFTRFDINIIRFGDQSLFVKKEIFVTVSGFNEKLIVMEDQEMIKRIKKNSRFIIIKKSVITSARKYFDNGIYKTQAVFFLIFLMYKTGYSQQSLLNTYRRLMKQDKL